MRCVMAMMLFATALTGGAQVLRPADPRSVTGLKRARADETLRDVIDRVIHEADGAMISEIHPLKVIHYEGLLHNDPIRVADVAALEEMDRLRTLAQAYLASGKPEYAVKARQIIEQWSEAYDPTGNPINENKLDPIWESYEALSDGFSIEKRASIEKWLDCLARANMATAAEGKNIDSNWHTKRIKIVATIGWAIHRPTFVDWAKEQYADYVQRSLYPDGTSFDLKHRDALSYHCAGLLPLAELALRARAKGVDFYSFEAKSGASLRKSVDYILPYARGEKVHAEWVNGEVELDHRRAQAGLEFYKPGKPWDPAGSIKLLEAMSAFDPAYAEIAARLRKKYSIEPTWNLVLAQILEAKQPATKPAGQ